MEEKTAAGAIVDCLRAEGIKKVFGLPGSQVLPLIDEVSVYRPVTKWSYMITHAEEVTSIIKKGLPHSPIQKGRAGPSQHPIRDCPARKDLLRSFYPPKLSRDL